MKDSGSVRNPGKALLLLVVLILLSDSRAWSHGKYRTLHEFVLNRGGLALAAGLVFDQEENLYGTTLGGGNSGSGVVFRLTRDADGKWRETLLHEFTGGKDGSEPVASLIFDRVGNLYGTTSQGGDGKAGVVFRLTPKPDGSWAEDVLHAFCSFSLCDDGSDPQSSPIFDQAGNLYGTTNQGGVSEAGVVFELTENADGKWQEKILHQLTGGMDGGNPQSSLIFDQAGNLYGTTNQGGIGGAGVVFELTENADGKWQEKILHQFTGGADGGNPRSSLIFDQAGNLYGTAAFDGYYGECSYGCGVVFELTPKSDGSWTDSVLHSFTGGRDGQYPFAGLTFDKAGNLYGTAEEAGNLTRCSGHGCGVVFKLTPNANGGWNETVLHTFLDQPNAFPFAGVIFDSAGNLYGTTYGDQGTAFGSVFEILR